MFGQMWSDYKERIDEYAPPGCNEAADHASAKAAAGVPKPQEKKDTPADSNAPAAHAPALIKGKGKGKPKPKLDPPNVPPAPGKQPKVLAPVQQTWKDATAERPHVLSVLSRATEIVSAVNATKKGDAWWWARGEENVGALEKHISEFRKAMSPFQHRYVTEPPDKLKKLVNEEVLSHDLQEFAKLTPKRKLLQSEVDRLVRRHMAGQDEVKDAQKKQKV